MSYKFWNSFVDKWQSLPHNEYSNPNPISPYNQIFGWTNPNLSSLMNDSSIGDFSLKYLPEPWWGNNGHHVLNSVIINYNPGSGDGIQGFTHSAGLFGCANFQDFANNEAIAKTNIFSATSRWHTSKRATRVFNTLSRIGIMLHGNNSLRNHLSIELIPWHTSNSLTLRPYINSNLGAIFNNCISFAANESKRVANTKLNKKVILRINGKMTKSLLDNFLLNGICQYSIINPISYTPSKRAGFFKFAINVIPDVEFISIWGKIGNDFPPDNDMDWIFINII